MIAMPSSNGFARAENDFILSKVLALERVYNFTLFKMSAHTNYEQWLGHPGLPSLSGVPGAEPYKEQFCFFVEITYGLSEMASA